MNSKTSLLTIYKRIPRELFIFGIAIFAIGMGNSVIDSIFNNFLDESFLITPFQRSFLEFPRELPGFLVVFVSAGLAFLCSRRLSAVTMLLSIVGVLLMAFYSPSYAVMTIWLFLYSLGQHLFFPLSATIGMELASKGKTGKRLGQINAVTNAAKIIGGLLVVLGFKYLNFEFSHTFVLAAIGFGIASLLFFAMKTTVPQPAKTFLKLHKEYNLYYLLVSISGARKQLFVTFAPWVLVTIFKQPTQIIASLLLIGGIIGILFQPFLGRTIDRYGERFVLTAEAVFLIFICFGYGFAGNIFSENIAFYIVCGCYLLDQMVFSVSMARSTYIKKIATKAEHVQSTLTAGVTIDHFFSIGAAIIGGIIWNAWGYQYVFLFGALLAVINFFVANQVKIPESAME
ncbi:MAG: MFS transporter [Anaerolineaceae bacterium]|nr:MFS transporter [Anaerolineaceae bacterium]